ncbi:MAG: hypothetical protein M3Y04_06510, partial [Actinomycetota bacterium]|nr:hypothetical protein [Actinomycetota bacterium]
GLATRLLLAQTLVLVAGAAMAWLVASTVGPGNFHAHLVAVSAGHVAAEMGHVEKAFASALIVALGVALAASVVAALAVTGYFTRRIQRSIAAVAHSASQIAEGRYGSHVPNPGLGVEFDQLPAPSTTWPSASAMSRSPADASWLTSPTRCAPRWQ